MHSLRFCLIGIALVLLAAGTLWVTGNSKITDPFVLYPFVTFDDFESALFFQFLILSVAGTGLLFLCRGIWSVLANAAPDRPLLRIFPELQLRHAIAWAGRRSDPSVISTVWNAFSVSWNCVLMTLVIIFMIMGPRPSTGLRVDWKGRSHLDVIEGPWEKTLGVFVKHPGVFYINRKAVKRAEFRAKLREELARRVEWTVYLEADYDTQFADTLYAIDTIQGLGGRVAWITPKMREDWQRESGWPSP